MKLEWEQNSPKEPMTWDEATVYAKSLGEGWRLPTRGELLDAYDSKTEVFQSGNYWSSSKYARDTNYVWSVYFDDGYLDNCNKANDCYVRCVREE